MYRALTIAFVFLCTALAWWALELQGKLVFKEKELFELRKERAAVREAEKQAQAEKAALLENVERLRKERDAAKGEGTEASDYSDSSNKESVESTINGFIKPTDTLEMNTMLRSRQREYTRKAYSRLFKNWNLSPQDAEVVFDALVERDKIDFSDTTTAKNAETDVKAKLVSILGPERIKELLAYEDEQEREQVVARYAEHLDITGSSLNSQQRIQLAELLRKEKSMDLFPVSARLILSPEGLTDNAIENNRKEAEELQSRIIRDAATFLSPDQVSGLQSAFREENEQTILSLKYMSESIRPKPSTTQGNREK